MGALWFEKDFIKFLTPLPLSCRITTRKYGSDNWILMERLPFSPVPRIFHDKRKKRKGGRRGSDDMWKMLINDSVLRNNLKSSKKWRKQTARYSSTLWKTYCCLSIIYNELKQCSEANVFLPINSQVSNKRARKNVNRVRNVLFITWKNGNEKQSAFLEFCY